jgi:hypothetical protein
MSNFITAEGSLVFKNKKALNIALRILENEELIKKENGKYFFVDEYADCIDSDSDAVVFSELTVNIPKSYYANSYCTRSHTTIKTIRNNSMGIQNRFEVMLEVTTTLKTEDDFACSVFFDFDSEVVTYKKYAQVRQAD